jgi:hypothetical protein
MPSKLTASVIAGVSFAPFGFEQQATHLNLFLYHSTDSASLASHSGCSNRPNIGNFTASIAFAIALRVKTRPFLVTSFTLATSPERNKRFWFLFKERTRRWHFCSYPSLVLPSFTGDDTNDDDDDDTVVKDENKAFPMCLLAYVLSERRRHVFSLWGKVREIFIKFITKKKLKKKLKKAEKHKNDDFKNERWCCWWW